MFKELYSFKVEKLKEVEKKVTKTRTKESGEEEEYEEVSKVEEKTPVSIIIKEPTRRELEEADMEYSIEISKCVKKGILTKGMLAKRYSDTGGLLTESDADRLTDLYAKLGSLQAEITQATIKPVDKRTKAQKTAIGKLYSDIAENRKDIINIESSYNTLFNHTADVKAQNKQLLWYIVNLTHVEEEGGTRELLYKGESFDDKVEDYYKKEEEQDELYKLCQGKISTIIVYWFHTNAPTKEEFDALIKDIDA
jgi:hypothetical protein